MLFGEAIGLDRSLGSPLYTVSKELQLAGGGGEGGESRIL